MVRYFALSLSLVFLRDDEKSASLHAAIQVDTFDSWR
jgi:hypothetical protein